MPASNRGLALSSILVQKFVTAGNKGLLASPPKGAWDMKDALHESDALIDNAMARPAAR
jgi:hypothetical protein